MFNKLAKWYLQLEMFKVAEEKGENIQPSIEIINSTLKEVMSRNYDFFLELISMAGTDEIPGELSKEDFTKTFLKKLSREDEVLSKYIGDVEETYKKSENTQLIEKGINLVKEKGEIGRVYKLLEQLQTSKVRDALKNNLVDMYKLIASGNYEELFNKLADSSPKIYALWSSMSRNQKTEVISKSKNIIRDMILEVDTRIGSINDTFSSSLESQVPSSKWQGFFKSVFYEGLFKPIYDAVKGNDYPSEATISPGKRIVVSSKDSYFYGLCGEVKKLGNNILTVEIGSSSVNIPIEDVFLYE